MSQNNMSYTKHTNIQIIHIIIKVFIIRDITDILIIVRDICKHTYFLTISLHHAFSITY